MHIGLDLSAIAKVVGSISRSQWDAMGQKVVEAVTYDVHRTISSLASDSLHATRRTYLNGLGQPQIGRMKGTITLYGQLANMIESGASPFDMKEGFQRSRKVKRTKSGGWYLTIPFRFAMAGAIGENSAFSGVLPKDISDFVKTMKTSITVPFIGTVRRGGRISKADLAGSKHGILWRDKIEGMGAKGDAYQHKSSIYEGAGKSKKFYELTSQGKVNTFRRVGSGSDQNSWIHKGLEKRDFFGKAVNMIDFETNILRVADEYMNAAGIWQ